MVFTWFLDMVGLLGYHGKPYFTIGEKIKMTKRLFVFDIFT